MINTNTDNVIDFEAERGKRLRAKAQRIYNEHGLDVGRMEDAVASAAIPHVPEGRPLYVATMDEEAVDLIRLVKAIHAKHGVKEESSDPAA